MSSLILYKRNNGNVEKVRIGSDDDPNAKWVFQPTTRTLQVQDGTGRYLTDCLGLTDNVSEAVTFNRAVYNNQDYTLTPDSSELISTLNPSGEYRLSLSSTTGSSSTGSIGIRTPTTTAAAAVGGALGTTAALNAAKARNRSTGRTRVANTNRAGIASTGVDGTPRPDITNQASCLALNAYWVADPLDPATGVCYQCSVGSQYVDQTANTCLLCSTTAKCGDNNGHCSGSTGPAGTSIPCVQDTTNQTFFTNCTSTGGVCEGLCSGSCKGLAAFGYTCQRDPVTGYNSCQFNPSNWWMIFLWVLAGLLVIGLIAYGIAAATMKKVRVRQIQQQVQVQPQPVYQVVGEPIQEYIPPQPIVQVVNQMPAQQAGGITISPVQSTAGVTVTPIQPTTGVTISPIQGQVRSLVV
jgi:hypothetical protein